MSIVPKSTLANVRNQFVLSSDVINFAGMAMSSHPKPVSRAIKRIRKGLDRQHYKYLKDNLHAAEDAVAAKAAAYFGASSPNIALTDGTTCGLTLLYAGLPFKPGQEILTTLHEFSGVLAIFDYLTKRQGIPSRRIALFDRHGALPSIATQDIVQRLKDAIQPNTRVLALTWVYSNCGVKLPLPEIAAMLKGINRDRPDDEKVLLCIDGVHGFGVEDMSFQEMGCDFFMSGCHKWICGPRGTGIWCGTSEAWEQYHQVAPTSSRFGAGLGRCKSPGGVQCYEHRWALEVAFEFLLELGKPQIQRHIHGLCSEFKLELSQMPGITLVTPQAESLSSGIICFDVEGRTAHEVVNALMAQGIITTLSSSNAGYDTDVRHVRVSLSIFNTRAESERVLDAVHKLMPAVVPPKPPKPRTLAAGAALTVAP
jgi:selenocysteine lyase/cysteine desulfurase